MKMHVQMAIMLTTVLAVSAPIIGAEKELHGVSDVELTISDLRLMAYLGLPHSMTTQQSKEIVDKTSVSSLNNVEPIHIGGARYKLSLSDFTPVPQTCGGACHGGVPKIIGYKTSVPVYGDFAQDLFFDIFGDSGKKSMTLNTQCGTYQDTDLGPEYTMSQVTNTNESCQNLSVSFTTDGAASSVDLTILISEEL